MNCWPARSDIAACAELSSSRVDSMVEAQSTTTLP